MCCSCRGLMRAIWCFVLAAVLVGVPLFVWCFHTSDYSAWFFAGIFVLLTLPVTFYEVAMHLEYYTRPELQIHVIRIHGMVPFYSLDSWLALRFLRARIYFDPLRECYEAYVLYSFYCYLGVYLDTEVGDLEELLALQPSIGHMWGLQYISDPWRMGPVFLWECKKGVLNYVIIRPITAVLAMVAKALNFYHEGQLKLDGMWFWTGLINTISQCWAIYCLVMFYRATKHELKPIRPVAKFMLIKSIIFLTYWQQLFVSLLVGLGWINIHPLMSNDAKDLSAGLQEFIICIEMFVAALVFAHVFSPKDYMDPSLQCPSFLTNLRRMFDMRDVAHDVKDVFVEDVQTMREKLGNITSRVVHTIGVFLKDPGEFFELKRWRQRLRRKPRMDHLGSQTPLLRQYKDVDWSLSLPKGLEEKIWKEQQQERALARGKPAAAGPVLSPVHEQSSETVGQLERALVQQLAAEEFGDMQSNTTGGSPRSATEQSVRGVEDEADGTLPD